MGSPSDDDDEIPPPMYPPGEGAVAFACITVGSYVGAWLLFEMVRGSATTSIGWAGVVGAIIGVVAGALSARYLLRRYVLRGYASPGRLKNRWIVGGAGIGWVLTHSPDPAQALVLVAAACWFGTMFLVITIWTLRHRYSHSK